MTKWFTVGSSYRRFGAALLAFSLIVAGSGGAHAAAPSPAKAGLWSAPFAEKSLFARRPPRTPAESKEIPPAVSMAVLPDGRVIYWGGLEGLEDSAAPLALDAGRSAKLSRARLLDLRHGKPSWTTPVPETGPSDDMFCADQRLLASGKLVIAGGTIYKNDPVDLTPATGKDGPGGTAELIGSKATRIFDPQTGRFTSGRPMHFGRWYPTLLTLPNGELFIASGVERLLYNAPTMSHESGENAFTNVAQLEMFTPSQRKWKLLPERSDTTLPLFARMHLMPDGTVFYSGTGQMWAPFGQSRDEAMWNFLKSFDPRTKAWTTLGMGVFGARSGAFSVLLPLKPPYKQARVLVAGGTIGTSPGGYVATDVSEVITVEGGEAMSTRGPDLVNPRWYSSGVLLPDGGVLALSGANSDEVLEPGYEFPVRQAELYDGKKWIPLSSGGRDRTYHNTAVLLPDGSVLVGGHSPINSGYGPKGDNTTHDAVGTANNLKDPSFEIFRPPYLFRGPRPSITRVDRGLTWNQSFFVDTPQASRIQRVVLVRLPSTTHVTDADMREIELPFKSASESRLSVQSPPNANVAPPGFYYVFVLTGNGQGLTPSKARIVRVASQPLSDAAPAPMGR